MDQLRMAILLNGIFVITILVFLLISLRFFWRRRRKAQNLFPESENEVKKNLLCSFINLPKEVTFSILILLPAEFLHKVARRVCKQWDDIVSDPIFVRAHCQLSTDKSIRFLVHDRNKLLSYYVEADYNKSVRVTEIELLSPAIISGSYNGVALITETRYAGVVSMMNLLTKVKVRLPRLRALNNNGLITNNLAVNSSGRFKVVSVSGHTISEIARMSVLTVGVDKAWRCVEIQGIPPMNRQSRCALLNSAIFVAGFMYWCTYIHRFCFAMDVDTETIYLFSRPESSDYHFRFHFISLGTGLGVMKEEYYKRGIWRLWKLTDVKASEWTEMAMIDIGAYYCLSVIPISLVDGELCFKYCDVSREFFRVVRYNLANKSFVSFRVKLPSPYDAYIYPHIPTLLSPKNLSPRLL